MINQKAIDGHQAFARALAQVQDNEVASVPTAIVPRPDSNLTPTQRVWKGRRARWAAYKAQQRIQRS